MLYPVWHSTIVLYTFFFSYAIFRYNIMDIKVAFTRMGIFVLVYSIVLGLPFGLAILGREWLSRLLGEGWFWAPMGTLLFLATGGPFIYLYLQRRAEQRLLQEELRIQDLLMRASYGMRSIRNLQRLLELINEILTKTLRLDNSSIYLRDPAARSYTLRVSRAEHKNETAINTDDPLIKRLVVTKYPVILEEIKLRYENRKNDLELREIIRQMEALAACVIIPAVVENTLIGFIVLGERHDKGVYSTELAHVLFVLGNQAALAIENCRFWEEETKRMQEEGLRERMVSLDYMASSMAHEIDNPVHIILQSVGFIKHCFAKDLRIAMPEDLKADFIDALTRSHEAAKRISGMIKAVLDFSRMGSVDLKPVLIQEAVENFMYLIEPQIKKEKVNFTKEIEADLPPVLGNRIQIEEIFMNFIRNSLHAVGRKEDKRIWLKIFKKNDKTIRIECLDNGYGIPKEIINDIFLSSTTTKGSSEGTGLGLFRVRKIVDFLNGQLWAESDGPDKGAKFVVELPVYKQ